jgi:hypothetical protein
LKFMPISLLHWPGGNRPNNFHIKHIVFLTDHWFLFGEKQWGWVGLDSCWPIGMFESEKLKTVQFQFQFRSLSGASNGTQFYRVGSQPCLHTSD